MAPANSTRPMPVGSKHSITVHTQYVWYVLYGMVWYGMVCVWYDVYGMVWYGMCMVWYGMMCMVWYDVYGMAWYGMVWYGMVWYGMVWYGMVWYDVVWYGVVWYGMVWYGMVWYGMVWYGMVWYGTVSYGMVDDVIFTITNLAQGTITRSRRFQCFKLLCHFSRQSLKVSPSFFLIAHPANVSVNLNITPQHLLAIYNFRLHYKRTLNLKYIKDISSKILQIRRMPS